MGKKITTKECIDILKNKYGDKFLYDKINYIGSKSYIILTCPKHGDFKIRATNALTYKNINCKECLKEKKEQEKLISFINKSKSKYKDTYDYSKVNYINGETNICLIHKEYGEFLVTPNNHLHNKNGLNNELYNKHKTINLKLTQEDFINICKKIHNDKYDYSITKYNGMKKNIEYICPIHGVIKQQAYDHLHTSGCKYCYYDSNKTPTNIWVEKVSKIHNNKYDYSKSDMLNRDEKGGICIICPIHGEFWQNPNNHLLGIGCPFCNESHLEIKIENILNINNINFEKQKKFDWLGRQSLDFYLPQYNIAIECQGIQHFKSKDFFGGEKRFNEQIERDKRKLKLCNENNLKLIYFAEKEYDNCIYDENKLIEIIKGG